MFCNSVMKPVRSSKPHIALIGGYWRVSPMPKPFHKHQKAFVKAHEFKNRLNAERNT